MKYIWMIILAVFIIATLVPAIVDIIKKINRYGVKHFLGNINTYTSVIFGTYILFTICMLFIISFTIWIYG